MKNQATKFSLGASSRKLVDLMSEINYGRIEGLVIAEGEPVFDPPPRVVRKIKLGADNGPRRQDSAKDFPLKEKVSRLLDHIFDLHDGTIILLEVQAGLPFSMEIEDSVGR